METAATFAVAAHFGTDRGSLLAVFDTLRGEEHILLSEEETDARRVGAQKAMLDIAFSTIAKHAAHSCVRPARD